MEVSDHVPHRTTYRQNNSWMVHEFQQSGCLCAAKRTGSHSAGIHVPFTNCFVCRWFCVVHDPNPPLHSHDWLSFGKFQDTERFLIHCERHFPSRLPPSGGTWKYAKAPSSTKKTWRDSLPIDMLLYAVSVLVVAQSISEIPEGLMNNPVHSEHGGNTLFRNVWLYWQTQHNIPEYLNLLIYSPLQLRLFPTAYGRMLHNILYCCMWASASSNLIVV